LLQPREGELVGRERKVEGGGKRRRRRRRRRRVEEETQREKWSA